MHDIVGPLVSSSDLDYHVAMFRQVFDLEVVTSERLTTSEAEAIWGVAGEVQSCVLRTPGSGYGVQVLEFHPTPAQTIRHHTRGLVPGAAKVMDFFTSDLEAALDRAQAFGLKITDEIACYDSPEGPVREAHAWVLDEMVCAFIDPPPAMQARFSSDLGRLISEPQSISGPTTELAASEAYFMEVFGFDVIYRYEVADSNFGAMIGASEPVHIRARNIGGRLTTPYIGMIDYGLHRPGDKLIEPVTLPVRGLLGVVVQTDDLAGICERAAPYGATLARHSATPDSAYPSSALLRAPNGMLLQVVEAGPQDARDVS
ncbi:MAG: hypothetical protein AAGA23_21365 [Pseudomonadota bacterium]